ncbi:acyl-[acyl-carrier-protein]--UDP-N-acetylglucosamine O-acyltransferase [Cephaloticoccus capnophilus]|uniref:Acyl-[acyl-carrier-protein]--UDP-N-acetylglucosamine O-acyltransferase n=1 Tax=Cephaloticoccus capnophilus TaxID=1548208 RepID=A0A139SMC9_9BACT|nr:acyl-ACP--UDP-N-acetylglucosamine O-acyltransferase [Cephaloticoccus capnophilus]KXU35669.1 acyl-[acyl-carrier-protein]--UDP-N-acetylglucosamine O-acyltransferase [Cephaloticoccus capnophilus]
MATTTIHPTAIVETGAVLGAGCEIRAHAIVTRYCVLGEGVVVHPFAVLGGEPQHLSFDAAGVESRVEIGAGTVIREHVTVNRASVAGGATRIGAGSFLMAASHVAHDCSLGEQVVLANAALLAGHVSVGAHTFLGGGAAVHQFCRIGESVMVAGHASITRDVPDFLMVAERDEAIALNTVGLRRRGISHEAIGELKRAFAIVFFTPGNIREVAREALNEGEPSCWTSAEARQFLAFFAEGQRGFVRARRQGRASQHEQEESL